MVCKIHSITVPITVIVLFEQIAYLFIFLGAYLSFCGGRPWRDFRLCLNEWFGRIHSHHLGKQGGLDLGFLLKIPEFDA